ncbi:hypothetical protein HMPREF9548_04967, partial [Escherichia coli MS 182-1]
GGGGGGGFFYYRPDIISAGKRNLRCINLVTRIINEPALKS